MANNFHLKQFLILFFLFSYFSLLSQERFYGVLVYDTTTVPFTRLSLNDYYQTKSLVDGSFSFENVPAGDYMLSILSSEYGKITIPVVVPSNKQIIDISSYTQDLEEVVVTGGMKEVSRKESIVNVEVYSGEFFKKNPTPSVYDALQMVNGVRPQLNCNICNTGDIHINGLEGPNTMILIDGMPIVSSLSSVYGLSGIPSALIERMEIIKGPASALYGSEAVGGVINIITKSPQRCPKIVAELRSNTWLETSFDLGYKLKLSNKVSVLNGLNYFNYSSPRDNNNDGFTDITLQHRISLFQKWNFSRKKGRLFTIAGRYLYEDRWGGEMDWNSSFRGTDSIYGESIYTSRWELISSYQLPLKEDIYLNFSLNGHDQNSYYGEMPFMGNQYVGFGQVYWDKRTIHHDLLIGSSVRYVYYDDNTTATSQDGMNDPNQTILPGVFFQDEILLTSKHKIMVGARYDHHNIHGHIFTPRLGYKWTPNENTSIRLNSGTGFRVVNVFTEDHAALTGARDVVIHSDIQPEKSYNVNLTLTKDIRIKNTVLNFDASAFYTYFNNKIIPDYELNTNEINYYNLNGYAISQGFNFNSNISFSNLIKLRIGATYTDVFSVQNKVREDQILTEKFSGSWVVSWKIKKWKTTIDYTGKVYSPMQLPLLNELDPRPKYSPWWSIQNIQSTFYGIKNLDIYMGLKNLLNWTPAKNGLALIARSHDPFDKQVQFDQNGTPLPTTENPYALTFDPSYVYAPNQGIRLFVGIRYTLP